MTPYQNNMRRGRPVPKPDICTQSLDMLAGIPIAMAYVPWQTWHHIYDSCKALERGTIFEELDKPFLGQRRVC